MPFRDRLLEIRWALGREWFGVLGVQGNTRGRRFYRMVGA